METSQQVTCGLHEGLATATGLSVSLASRRTRVIFALGEGAEAGTLGLRSLRVIRDKEPLVLGSFFLCPPFCPTRLPASLSARTLSTADEEKGKKGRGSYL